MKKSRFVIVLSVVMALLLSTLPSMQIAAAEAQNGVEYISEVKIGVGEKAEDAAKALDGYTILKDGNNYVDLNQKAGGGIGSKGERVVYLGYKTTTERTEAITDLAVMNMKGGYSVKDYELLMEQYMTEQIIPFVNNFLATIKEYRENYNSDNEENKVRAQYVHDALNKLTDDDCGGAGLGDLLLNETKYEMGDAAYNALSETEKMKHADIVTIISQANGKATLLIENLITRAADTNNNTWIDRFVNTTYDDLLALYPDMLPSEAKAQLAKDYDNDARVILSMWSAFKEQLDNYDKKTADYETLAAKDLTAQYEIIEKYDASTATEEQTDAFAEAIAEIEVTNDSLALLYSDISLRDFLSTIEYDEGTLADFFLKDYETVKDDITILYPLVASLTKGQRAGLEFVTLSDLVMFMATNSEGYNELNTEEDVVASIYEGVDREIYKKGGVALTSDALRTHAAEEVAQQGEMLSFLTYMVYGATAATMISFAYSIYAKVSSATTIVRNIEEYTRRLTELNKKIQNSKKWIGAIKSAQENMFPGMAPAFDAKLSTKLQELKMAQQQMLEEQMSGTMDRLKSRTPMSAKLAIGLGIVMVVLSAISLYLTYRDLVNYYSVDYTPIPKYIVDEKDMTVYNEKGEKIVIKNQSAYYKAVETNRSSGDEWFDILGSSADLNGTVGRQWLALYAAKNENMCPIIADSLKVVVGKTDIPTDYTTGIHMFGSGAAYNLNNTQFVWNNEAPSVFVYFNVDTGVSSEPSTTGSSFSAGYLVLTGVIGLVIGAGLGVLVMISTKRRKVTA